MTVRNMLLRLAALALAVGVGGCKVLDVSDPLAIEEEDVRNAEGAELVRRRVIWFLQTEFSRIASHGAGTAGLGIADMLRDQMIHEGLSPAEATRRFYPLGRPGQVGYQAASWWGGR